MKINTSIAPCGKYGLLLGRQHYINMVDSDNLLNSKRHFVIYKWSNLQSPITSNNKIINRLITQNTSTIEHAYIPWVAFGNGKFSIIKSYRRVQYEKIMSPMHKWFKDDIELKDWMGEKMFNLFVADLV